MRISVVTLIYQRNPERLQRLLWTLECQTLQPLEVIVVDLNNDEKEQQRVADVCEIPLLARRIHAPLEEFSLSRGINIGIKNTSEDADVVLATSCDILFSPEVVEEVARLFDCGGEFVLAECGFLVKGVSLSALAPNWKRICQQIEPNPPTRALGAILAARRAWWFEVRGYDENYPFRHVDSEVVRRVNAAGLKLKTIKFDKAQVLHEWHPQESKLLKKLGGGLTEEFSIVVNDETWGCNPSSEECDCSDQVEEDERE